MPMKAIVFTQYGSPDGLELREVPMPAPKDDELLIKIRASSVNSWDWEFLNGVPFVNRLMFGLLKPKPKGREFRFRVDLVDVWGPFLMSVGRARSGLCRWLIDFLGRKNLLWRRLASATHSTTRQSSGREQLANQELGDQQVEPPCKNHHAVSEGS